MSDVMAEHERRDRNQARRAGRALKRWRYLPWPARLWYWAVTSW